MTYLQPSSMYAIGDEWARGGPTGQRTLSPSSTLGLYGGHPKIDKPWPNRLHVMSADAGFLYELNLANVAAHAFLEVDIGSVDGSGRALLFTDPTPLTLLYAADPKRREQRSERQRGTQGTGVSAVKARDDNRRDENGNRDSPE